MSNICHSQSIYSIYHSYQPPDCEILTTCFIIAFDPALIQHQGDWGRQESTVTLQNIGSPVVLWEFDSAVVTLLNSRMLSSAEVYKSKEHSIIPQGECKNIHKVTPCFG